MGFYEEERWKLKWKNKAAMKVSKRMLQPLKWKPPVGNRSNSPLPACIGKDDAGFPLETWVWLPRIPCTHLQSFRGVFYFSAQNDLKIKRPDRRHFLKEPERLPWSFWPVPECLLAFVPEAFDLAPWRKSSSIHPPPPSRPHKATHPH